MTKVKFNYNYIHIIFMLAFMALLSSCSHTSRQDGPPNFYVDETRIPNATPKSEARAKYGNMAVYNVFGRKYYPMQSSKNYSEVGIASWYGTKFHAQRTSSGERYNMLAMTAAHKTLPLPTYVEVTNLKNNRTIIVKVNDRGPFEQNRLIDLSYVAAKKLGMLGHGTTKVRVTAIDPNLYAQLRNNNSTYYEASRKRSVLYANNRNFSSKNKRDMYLRVGAFKSKSNALRLKQRLAAMHIPVTISKGKLYQVHVGPLKDTQAVNHMSNKLNEIGISSNRV